MSNIKLIQQKNSQFYANGVASDTAVIFLHGVPLNSKLWLPVMELMPTHRCYAIDLKGFGYNANTFDLEPKDFNLKAQLSYLEQTIAEIKAENFIFIMHGWSAIPGTMLAQKLGEKVVGLAYFEAQLRPIQSPEMLSIPMQAFAKQLMAIANLEHWVMQENGYAKLFFEHTSMTDLATLEAAFGAQTNEIACRAAILQYLYEIPLGFNKTKVLEAIEMNSVFLSRTQAHKCLFYATPGFMTPMANVAWAKELMPDLHLVDLGHALHCAPMTLTDAFAKELTQWLTKFAQLSI